METILKNKKHKKMSNDQKIITAYEKVIEKMLLYELQSIADSMGYIICKIQIEKK